ncbi:lytic murein transglycosylase [Aestuariivirga sp. YIM B02566]|uniref:Lytic murein transglycosylase n=1 Tax=Taklimakanibacter albus TaxID=2800327 RepID=A0ACC5R5P6_9HYPH|nr:lytic murein transglycosylase [Aestuariivirga sp. YIM B02566]MBK1867976.1 lytic murein transglycosylase [Aestuariivirga sp. YIM B02566]
MAKFKYLAAVILAAGLTGMLASTAFADAKFESFIQSLWPKAKASGISRDVFDRAFAGITEPDPTVLKLANEQPEFTSTTSQYLGKAVTQIRIDAGQSMKSSEADLLSAIEKRYRVDRAVLLAIWGMESNFGKDKGQMSVMRSLATLLYSGRRKDYARNQYIAALKILQSGIVSPQNFTGSWAGAMGHTQFVPTSYLSFAVDWTGDGKKDIWNSSQDALASTANYLAKAGWKNDRPWGWEVQLPTKFDRALIGRSNWRPVAEWVKLGLKPARGGNFGAPKADAFVMVPQGVEGPAFLVTRNFMAIMDYNQSHSYALAVGHLADRIKGGQPFVGSWPNVDYDLTFNQRVEIQTLLYRRGFDPGGTDGRFGARTYEAILGFQHKTGLKLDGTPTVALLERLRTGS